jgi:hypothetical protein
MDLYNDSPIRLHGAVLNLLSTGTTLPFIYLVFIVLSSFCLRCCFPNAANKSPFIDCVQTLAVIYASVLPVLIISLTFIIVLVINICIILNVIIRRGYL